MHTAFLLIFFMSYAPVIWGRQAKMQGHGHCRGISGPCTPPLSRIEGRQAKVQRHCLGISGPFTFGFLPHETSVMVVLKAGLSPSACPHGVVLIPGIWKVQSDYSGPSM